MNMTMSEKQVTSLEAMRAQSKGALVSLPPFNEGEELIVRLKRPSMLGLMKSGKIPNALIVSANKLFKGGPASFQTEDEEMMKELFSLFDIICEETFVEPTYKQIKDAGISLTDDQLIFIFGYTQAGVKHLESFRVQSGNAQAGGGVPDTQY